MKNSIIMVCFFAGGIIVGLFAVVPELEIYVLYSLMFFVGIGVGIDLGVWKFLKSINVKIIFVPLSIIIGTLLGTSLVSIFIPDISLREALAIGAGFGYYSLSSILITQIKGEVLGMLALLTNIFRELFTLLLTPFLVKYFSKLSSIASGGATSMDTTLPVITKFSGKRYVPISIFSGTILTILVPFLVTFFLR
jgi:uncharacterized membrane protein YbjE (DUF340 family)